MSVVPEAEGSGPRPSPKLEDPQARCVQLAPGRGAWPSAARELNWESGLGLAERSLPTVCLSFLSCGGGGPLCPPSSD